MWSPLVCSARNIFAGGAEAVGTFIQRTLSCNAARIGTHNGSRRAPAGQRKWTWRERMSETKRCPSPKGEGMPGLVGPASDPASEKSEADDAGLKSRGRT